MFLDDIVNPLTVAEAKTDYQKRREHERRVELGNPTTKPRQSKQTDYQKRRAEQRRQEELGEDSWHAGDNAWSSEQHEMFENVDAVAGAITRRILQQRIDLLKQYGPELVGAAVDDVADYVGDVDEIGSSDVSAWVAQVERMLRENPPEAFAEGFQDFNKVEPYAVCLAGKPVKKFDYYEDARRFHDNWKKKLYNAGDKEKADKITLMPLNLDEEEQKPAGWGEFPPKQEITIVPPKKLKSGQTYQDRNKYWQSQGQAPIYKTNEAEGRVDPILIKALNRMPDGLATHGEVLNACYDAYAMELGRMEMKSNYGTTHAYVPQLMDLYKQKHSLTFKEEYTPSPAKPFRNPKGFNKQGTGLGNKLAQLNRKEWEEKKKKEQGVAEAGSPAQQAAIAIAMKKAGKKPKQVDEFAPGPDRGDDEVPDQILKLANRWWNAGAKQPQITNVLRSLGWSISQVESEDDAVQMTHDNGTTYFISADDFDPEVFEDTGSWIVYDPETRQIKKRFKTHTAGKSYAKTHGLGFASSEYYFDNIKEKEVAEVKQRLDAKCWKGKHKEGTKIKGGVRVNNCVPNESVAEGTNYWTKLQNERNTKIASLVNELKESIKK